MALLAPKSLYLTPTFLAESSLWKLAIFLLLIVENHEELNYSKTFTVNNLQFRNNFLVNNVCESGLIATNYKKIYGSIFRTLSDMMVRFAKYLTPQNAPP